MFKDFIKQQIDYQFYPIISLLTFIVFFAALIIRTFLMKKEDVEEIKNIPLN